MNNIITPVDWKQGEAIIDKALEIESYPNEFWKLCGFVEEIVEHSIPKKEDWEKLMDNLYALKRKCPHKYKIVTKDIENTHFKLFGKSPSAEIVDLAKYRRAK